MQCWALAGDGVEAWATGYRLPSWAVEGPPCTTSTDAGVRENHGSLPLGAKAVGSLGHQMMPCVMLQS